MRQLSLAKHEEAGECSATADTLGHVATHHTEHVVPELVQLGACLVQLTPHDICLASRLAQAACPTLVGRGDLLSNTRM